MPSILQNFEAERDLWFHKVLPSQARWLTRCFSWSMFQALILCAFQDTLVLAQKKVGVRGISLHHTGHAHFCKRENWIVCMILYVSLFETQQTDSKTISEITTCGNSLLWLFLFHWD